MQLNSEDNIPPELTKSMEQQKGALQKTAARRVVCLVLDGKLVYISEPRITLKIHAFRLLGSKAPRSVLQCVCRSLIMRRHNPPPPNTPSDKFQMLLTLSILKLRRSSSWCVVFLFECTRAFECVGFQTTRIKSIMQNEQPH